MGAGDNIFCYSQDPGGFVWSYTCYPRKRLKMNSEWRARVWNTCSHTLWINGELDGPPTPEAAQPWVGEPDPATGYCQYRLNNLKGGAIFHILKAYP